MQKMKFILLAFSTSFWLKIQPNTTKRYHAGSFRSIILQRGQTQRVSIPWDHDSQPCALRSLSYWETRVGPCSCISWNRLNKVTERQIIKSKLYIVKKLPFYSSTQNTITFSFYNFSFKTFLFNVNIQTKLWSISFAFVQKNPTIKAIEQTFNFEILS